MSGMQAANLITAIEDTQISSGEAAVSFSQWMREWFEHDVAKLRDLYPSDTRQAWMQTSLISMGTSTPFFFI